MTLQPVSAVNCASLLQPGCSLLSLDGDIFLFGQKGWPKRSCPTGIFMVRLKRGELKLRPVSFSNDSCYLPPLRCPAVAHLDPWGSDPECYLIHGGRTPNNEISGSLYLLNQDSRGSNRKVTLRCQEKELVGEMPGPRFGHTASVVYSRGKRACVLFGGRCYRPPGERTTETWNCVMDCPPQVFLIDLDFGCCSSHIVPELTDGQSFHVALARDDCIYILGGHNLSSDTRPVRLLRIQVQLLLGGPVLSCDIMDNGLSLTSTITVKSGPGHEYVVLGGYQSEIQKRLECNNVVLDDTGIHIEPRDPPPWTGEITHSRTWFGGSLGKGSALIGVPTEGRSAQPDAHSFYQVSFQMEGDGSGEEAMQGCSQESTDFEDSAPLEDSEELYFGREPHELEDSSDDGDGDTYNEEDEEDESQTGYWMSCCLGCHADPNTWVPYYSTELHRPAMIFCSGGEGGHWVHAQCMDLTETLLMKLSQNSSKYFCLDHGGMPRKEMTPPRTATPLKRVTMKSQHRKAPIRLRMTPTKKSFLRRLFD